MNFPFFKKEAQHHILCLSLSHVDTETILTILQKGIYPTDTQENAFILGAESGRVSSCSEWFYMPLQDILHILNLAILPTTLAFYIWLS